MKIRYFAYINFVEYGYLTIKEFVDLVNSMIGSGMHIISASLYSHSFENIVSYRVLHIEFNPFYVETHDDIFTDLIEDI